MTLRGVGISEEELERFAREQGLPGQKVGDLLTRMDELLIANLKLMKEVGTLVKVQIGPEGGLDLAEARKRAESGEWVPYSVKTFALDAARADEPVTIEGDFIHAWTDGDYEGIGVRFNIKTNDLIYFQRRNPIHGFRFWKLFLSNTAQAGKTLDLLIGREASAYAETYSITAILENKVSAILDSTTTNLGDGATYTGGAFSVEKYGVIVGSVYADRSGTLYIDQSEDGTNWDISESTPYIGGDALGFFCQVLAPTARVRFTNPAGAAQTTFRLYVRARRM